MMVPIRYVAANAAIENVFQQYVDDKISLDNLFEKLNGMYQPIVGKMPSECSQSELDIVARCHNNRAEFVIRDTQLKALNATL